MWNRAPHPAKASKGLESEKDPPRRRADPVLGGPGNEAAGNVVVDGAPWDREHRRHAGQGRGGQGPEYDWGAQNRGHGQDNQVHAGVAEVEQGLVPPSAAGEPGGPDKAE